MELISGYKEKYDPWIVLERAALGDRNAIGELWENLYHQGDVGSASYASVPKLVELGALDLVAAIEVARNSGNNPTVPDELKQAYFAALNTAISSAPSDENQLKSFYAIHASLQGQHSLAKVLDFISISEVLGEIG